MHTANDLAPLVAQLSARDQEFAQSLIAAAQSPRGASERQAYWIDQLVQRARPAPAPVAPTPVAEQNLLDLFARAEASKLKEPRIRFRVGTADAMMRRATLRDGTSALAVYVGRYPNRRHAGNVRAGAFHPRRDEPQPQLVAEAVQALAANPAGTALEFGKLTGFCMFCGLFLTDPRSVEKGYGPICAQNWGLPWGAATTPELSLADLGF